MSNFNFPDDLGVPHCHNCINLVGLLEEQRYADNMLAGCGVDGHLVSNDDKGCNKHKFIEQCLK